MDVMYTPPADAFESARKKALYIGIVGLVACAVGFALEPAQAFRAWLVAFWTALSHCVVLQIRSLPDVTVTVSLSGPIDALQPSPVGASDANDVGPDNLVPALSYTVKLVPVLALMPYTR